MMDGEGRGIRKMDGKNRWMRKTDGWMDKQTDGQMGKMDEEQKEMEKRQT